jgi:hypothetical protein
VLGTGETTIPEQLDEKMVRKLCEKNPTIHAAMNFYFQGELSYTQALILATKSMNDQCVELQRLLEDSYKHRAAPQRVYYIPD